MALDLLDDIMRQLTAIYDFFMAAIQKSPKLCLSVIIRSRNFCIYAIRQPHHCLGNIVINYYQIITFITVCHLIFIYCEMVSIEVSVGLCFEFDECRALVQAQTFRELLCNSENLAAEIYNVHIFTTPQPRPKPNIIPTSKCWKWIHMLQTRAPSGGA